MDKALVKVATKRAIEMAATDGANFAHPLYGLLFGENIHLYTIKNLNEVDCSSVTKDWYSEIEDYDWNSHEAHKKMSTAVGHFTQIVWKSTTRLGCATVNSKGPKGGTFTVCTYHPPGNVASIAEQNVIPSEKCNRNNEDNKNLYDDLTSDRWNQECLSEHNKLRKMHGVPSLILDSKIVEFARNRAIEMAKQDNADFGHTRSVSFSENLHWGKRKSGPTIRCEEPVKLWYNEINNYDWQQRVNHKGEFANFAQIVWKSTKKLGCAQVLSKGIKGGTYTVCAYEPCGNIPNITAHENNVFFPNKSDNINYKSLIQENLPLNSTEEESDSEDITESESSTDEATTVAKPLNVYSYSTETAESTEKSTNVPEIENTTLLTKRRKLKSTSSPVSTPLLAGHKSKKRRKSHVRLAMAAAEPRIVHQNLSSMENESKFKPTKESLESSFKNFTRSLTEAFNNAFPKISG